MLEDFAYGRADANIESESGDSNGIPSASNYISRLGSLGLSTEEIVAVSNIESFGVHQDPNHSRWSSHPKFDNYFYKSLVTQSGNDHPLHDALMNNVEAKEQVERFAENREEFNEVFKTGFVKLCDLGSNGDELLNIEHILIDDPNSKLRFPNEYN